MAVTEGPTIAKDKQIVVRKGMVVPFNGVLVPEDLFREYQLHDFESSITKKDLADCQVELESIKPSDNRTGTLWFIGGFIVGALATGALRR